MKNPFSLLFILCFVSMSVLPICADDHTPPVVRNMILMIGDGMGAAQIQLASDYAGKDLVLTSLPVRGALQTASANSAVTDSAASGTALACGNKTNNGMLGQLPDGTNLVSIAEQARNAGKRVGVVTSVQVNHATPAAFYAKVDSRRSAYEIGLQALASRFDVLGGSGFIDPEGKNHNPRPEKTLLEEAEKSGYQLVRIPSELAACVSTEGRRWLFLPQKFHDQERLPYGEPVNAEKDLTLAQITAKAIEVLKNPNGFFLMVEGGAIDWAAHDNDAIGVAAETLAFDDAVAVARAFAEANPGTLLVVTADHETGGLTFKDGYEAEAARAALSRQKAAKKTVRDWLRKHAATGWDAVKDHIGGTLGISDDALKELETPYRTLISSSEEKRDKALDALLNAAFAQRDKAVNLAWTTCGHTNTDVPLHAYGPGAERFSGTQDNTQVFTHGKALLLPSAP